MCVYSLEPAMYNAGFFSKGATSSNAQLGMAENT